MLRFALLVFLFCFSAQLIAAKTYKSEKDYLKDSSRKIDKDCTALLMKAVEVNQNVNKAKNTKHILFDRPNVHKKLQSFYKKYKAGASLGGRILAYDQQQSLEFFTNCRKIMKHLQKTCKINWADPSALQYCANQQIQAEMLPYLQKVATPSRAKIPKIKNRAN